MEYTVIGTVDNECEPRELTIAGIVEGRVQPVDSDPGNERRQRWAGSFSAESPEEVEVMAHAWFADGEDE